MGTVPNPGEGFRLVAADAGTGFVNCVIFDKGFPFLVVAVEPSGVPFGGINGWNRMDSRFGLAV